MYIRLLLPLDSSLSLFSFSNFSWSSHIFFSASDFSVFNLAFSSLRSMNSLELFALLFMRKIAYPTPASTNAAMITNMMSIPWLLNNIPESDYCSVSPSANLQVISRHIHPLFILSYLSYFPIYSKIPSRLQKGTRPE